MTPYATLLDGMKGKRALVVGDVMLDDYVFGTASRISPEAPVIVIRQERTNSVPGGAANVAKNIVALGGVAELVGVVGDDDAGAALSAALSSLDGVAPFVIVDGSRVTTKKTRIVADHSHQVLRIDNESTSPLAAETAARMIDAVKSRLADCHVVVLSDYLKGALFGEAVMQIVQAAQGKGIPVVANPKPSTARDYRGTKIVSLNRSEAAEFVGQAITNSAIAEEAAVSVREQVGCEVAIVTLGELGMLASTSAGPVSVAAPKVEVYDTAGAGDTVIATLALCQASGVDIEGSMRLSVQTSARVVRHVGVAVPDERDLAEIRTL